MGKKETPLEKVAHKVGDKVTWQGIPLTVTEIRADGSIEAMSLTMRVLVGEHEQFKKVA